MTDFNPRSYKRSDGEEALCYRNNCYFNPRSYKRSDLDMSHMQQTRLNFNPRSYKRSDPLINSWNSGWEIFQSTLLQEERRDTLNILKNVLLFQSTLLQEERPILRSDLHMKTNFNPRSYKRSDLWGLS